MMYNTVSNEEQHVFMGFGNMATFDDLSSHMIPIPKPPKQLMNTIAETARLCRERDMGLNDSTLRYLCKNGMLPCVKIGSKTLINWNILIHWLFSEEPVTADKTEQPETETGTIRPIPAKLKR